MDCRVVVEAAVPVYDVETADEAVRIAISKTGEMLNPDLNYVEISMGTRTTPEGEELPPAFIAADEALVALELEMTVFNVDREEHASRIARKEIGQLLRNIPLKVLEVEDITEDADDESEPDDQPEQDQQPATDRESDPDGDSRADTDAEESGSDEERADAGTDVDESATAAGEDDLLPEFEEMVDE